MHSIIRGWIGEKLSAIGLWAFLDDKTYARFHNVIIPSRNGTTQIDHIIVSIYGVFVIETKNYKGWIFGSPQSAKWTQSIFRKKFQFQNPLKQNYRHTKCLAEFLKLHHSVFRSAVFFIGECEFKTDLPPNVLNHGFVSYIQSFTQPCLTSAEVLEVVEALDNLRTDPLLTEAAHLASLQERHDSTTNCPRCGSSLVQRPSSKARPPFLGCSSFPNCKFTKSLPENESEKEYF